MIRSLIRSALTYLGKTEDTFLAIGIGCLTSASLRPLITLHNKKEALADRSYAAKRECINGFVAFTCVLTFSEVFKRLGNWVFTPAFKHLPHDARMEKLRAMSILSGAVGTAVSNLAIPNIGNMLIGPVDKLFGKKPNTSIPTSKAVTLTPQPLPQPLHGNTQVNLLSQPPAPTSIYTGEPIITKLKAPVVPTSASPLTVSMPTSQGGLRL
jgi:hypothetical protein